MAQIKHLQNITHLQNDETSLTSTPTLQETVDAIKKRLKQSSNLVLPLEKSLDLLEQLTCFELGRFLLLNKGYNGYWTSYFTLPPQRKEPLHPLEEWFLTKSPSVLAVQERFKISQQQAQKHLKPNMVIASLPCGLMDDLLSLNYEGLENVEIVGIDIDPETLQQAQDNSYRYGVKNKVSFLQKDAWHLNISSQFDLITCSGLSSYEPNTERVIDLYRNFYNALRPGGILNISCSSPPPPHPQSMWQGYEPKDLLIRQSILLDIVQAKWVNCRTEEQMRQHLTQAGFNQIDVIYDSRKILPTYVARKL